MPPRAAAARSGACVRACVGGSLAMRAVFSDAARVVGAAALGAAGLVGAAVHASQLYTPGARGGMPPPALDVYLAALTAAAGVTAAAWALASGSPAAAGAFASRELARCTSGALFVLCVCVRACVARACVCVPRCVTSCAPSVRPHCGDASRGLQVCSLRPGGARARAGWSPSASRMSPRCCC